MKLDKMLALPVKALVILFFVQIAFVEDGTWLKHDGVGTGGDGCVIIGDPVMPLGMMLLVR